jgi:hypothetical protein
MRRMVIAIFVPAAMFSTVVWFVLLIPSDLDKAVYDYVERVA